MAKTKIDWATHSINPVKGLCPMTCPYCYARRMYKRFKWDPEIRFEKDVMDGTYLIQHQPDRKRIFVGSTMELFGPWVKEEWLKYIFSRVATEHWNTFIFLTKQPHNLAKWSPFPPNCWVGGSGTDIDSILRALACLRDVNTSVKFLSIEPLLSDPRGKILDVSLRNCGISWLIIGAQTGPGAIKPKLEWVREITEAADMAGIPVFLKNNLKPLIQEAGFSKASWAATEWVQCAYPILRQEFPKGEGNG